MQQLIDLASRVGLVPAHALAEVEQFFTAEAHLPANIRQTLDVFQLGLAQFHLLIALLNTDPRGASLGYLQSATSLQDRQLQPELSLMARRGFVRWTQGCAELTEAGREFAVYAIYRVLTVASPGRGQA